jgi:hypothetical protein
VKPDDGRRLERVGVLRQLSHFRPEFPRGLLERKDPFAAFHGLETEQYRID